MEPPSPFQETVFEQGHEVGRLAHQLFPGGVLVEEDHTNPEGALEKTRKLLSSGATAIFEAAFLYDNILIRSDIIAKNAEGTWDLFEVKSTTSVKKKEHLHDAAIQKFVLKNAGFPLRNTHIIHLNNEYIRQGTLDVMRLFTKKQVDSEIIEQMVEISGYVTEIRKVLGKESVPKQAIGSICKSPYPCEFKTHCWLGVEPDSILFLSRISDSKRMELVSRAISKIKDVPDDIALTELQFVQVKVEREGKPNVERDKIKKHLSDLRYPLWFLDFETYGFAIPEYDGTRSYEQLPFQFSVHIEDSPGSALRHIEFLHPEKSDPRRALAEALAQAIGSGGSVITYHASFERGRIEELAEAFPDLQQPLMAIVDRIFDLETPFAKKWYYDSRFQGSSSIKKVLPVLVPHLSYDGMEIGKGDIAQMKYMEMISMPMGSPEREAIRKNLLAYCGLDTLAMVEILRALQRL